MIGTFEANFAGSELREGQNGAYVIGRFVEETGKPFEVMTRDTVVMDTLLKVPQFAKCIFKVDCVQGKYTRFDIKSIEVRK